MSRQFCSNVMKGRIFFISLVLFLAAAGKMYAADVPPFPSCTNPQGTTLASYSDGIHGIAGDSATHTGSDSVFQLSSTQDMQCFCNGTSGIQTNWWKVEDMPFDEINRLQKQGWTYIPDGSLWGLDQAAYLAYNLSFSCPAGTGGGSDPSDPSNSAVNEPGIKGVLGAMASTGLFADHLFTTIGIFGVVLLSIALLFSKKCRQFLGLL